MPTLTFNEIYSAGGETIQGLVSRTGDFADGGSVSIPAAKAGVLSVRGGDGAGTINGLVTGHGLIATDIVDVFWTVAGVNGRRYNVVIDTANANDIVFDNTPTSAGDVLPIATTPVTVCKQVTIAKTLDADVAVFFAAQLSARGLVQFRDVANALVGAVVDLIVLEAWKWISGQGANPLTGNPVTQLRVTNADSVAAATFKLINLYDATP
jgi:hypothetical protein